MIIFFRFKTNKRMERTALLLHIKQTSYMKKMRKIFTTLKDIKTDTYLRAPYKSNNTRKTHLEIKRQQQKRWKKSDS